MSNSTESYERFTSRDQIEFNKVLIDETEVKCQWEDEQGLCNEPVKEKDFSLHLYRRHGITSDSLLYRCLWQDSDCPHESKKESLERHMTGKHVPVKWACLHCHQTFTRERAMM
ncbi:hypothetical protein JVU11DRAFT_9947 [Chiua virens]|nr:hypothetical protein JVU11DRAFT_9947 [Chiua virens]